MYYKAMKLYVNLPDEWEQLIYDFVDNGLQNKNDEIDTSSIYIQICMEHKYISKNGLEYYSPGGCTYATRTLENNWILHEHINKDDELL